VPDQPDYYVEIRGLEQQADPDQIRRAGGGGSKRAWIGVHFQCCDVYARIYRNREGTAYVGRCPQCLAQVRIRVGPEGTDDRFFVAY